MKKIPFDISHKEGIDAGEFKLQTANGFDATLIDLDEDPDEEYPIIAGIDYPGRGVVNFRYNYEGIRKNCGNKHGLDLVLYEKEVDDYTNDYIAKYNKWYSDHELWDGDYNTSVKMNRSEFLSLVKKIYEDGYKAAKDYYEPRISS